MNKTTTLALFIILLSCTFLGNAQTISSRIVDSLSKKPVPFATIQLANKKGVISNEEGYFSLLLDASIKTSDSLFISCLGYESLAKPLSEFTESVIYLKPKAIELNDVVVSNKQYTPEEIIKKVKENLEKNYNYDLSKKRLFFRESYLQNLTKTDFTFKKSSIAELNEAFLDSVLNSIPKSYSYYTEVLCDVYGDYTTENQKIDLIKASELYDKTDEIGLNALEDKFNQIIKKNVKPNSYFKIKSGIFGTKVGLDEVLDEEDENPSTEETEALKKEIEAQKKKETDRKENFAKYRRNKITGLMQGLFFQKKADLNVIRKSNKYEFEILDFTYLGDAPVYMMRFNPKGSADYEGTLYVNADDFAVIRIDYSNVKSLRRFRLLGISFDKYLAQGKMIFNKNESGKYDLLYLEFEDAGKFGIKRPLKIIEKNKYVKGRRKQNELSLKLDMATRSREKFEIVVFDTKGLTTGTFGAFAEKNSVLPVYMPKYDPEFWKGYNIIEPNQAIKEFTAKE